MYEAPSPAKKMVPSKGVHLLIPKRHSILAVANLLAHNNKSQICYCGQISLQSAAVFFLTPLGVPFILLAVVLFISIPQECEGIPHPHAPLLPGELLHARWQH